MLRNLTALLSFLFIALPLFAKDDTDGFIFFTPSTFDSKTELLISGKRREYFALQEGQQIELKIKGPSRLKVISRVALRSAADSSQYTYLILRKGSRKTLTFSHSAHASDKASFVGDFQGALGVSRTKIIDIPRGEHTYVVYLPKGIKHKLFLRFALDTNAFTEGTPVVAMTPSEFTTQVDIVSGEDVSSYYRIGTGHHAAIKLIGPATLKVMARIEFDETMTGRQKWKVQVTEDSKVKGTYVLAATRSDISVYRDPTALVASRAETFYVEIPAGEHRYEFTMPDNHRTTLLRFLLPENQLERE